MVGQSHSTQSRVLSPSSPKYASPNHAHSEMASSRSRAPLPSGEHSMPISTNRRSMSSRQIERDVVVARLAEVHV